MPPLQGDSSNFTIISHNSFRLQALFTTHGHLYIRVNLKDV